MTAKRYAWWTGGAAVAALLIYSLTRADRETWIGLGILAAIPVLAVCNSMLTYYRPDRRQLLKEYDALKERVAVERRIAADNKWTTLEDRRRAEQCADEIDTKLANMRRTGRLPD